MKAPALGLLRGEWTKLRTLPATPWLLLALALVPPALGAALVLPLEAGECAGPEGCGEDLVRQGLAGVRLGQFAAALLGVLALGAEHTGGTLRLTFVATPRRHRVLLAKGVVVAGVVTAAGAVGVLASVLVARLLLPRGGFTEAAGHPALSLADGATLRAAVGSVLYLVLVAALGLGAAAVFREPAAAIGAVLALLLLAPVLVDLVADPLWRERLARLAPMTAGLAVQATTDLDRLPIQPWPGLGVLAGHAAAWLAAGAAALHRRSP
ncbi:MULTISPECIES: ABC transporter permease subunit [Streptomyces]|uniref:ABC transporter permease subunit n=1 Tax=Streptomyces TaxID=1883 RepID=UPI001D03CF6D|nr:MULTISPECIES: ABC transporter permease subunit [Streptomyces]